MTRRQYDSTLSRRSGCRDLAIGFGSIPDLSWLLIVPVLALQFLFNSGLALIMARAGAKTRTWPS